MVINIKKLKKETYPQNEKFILDTNVLYCVFYTHVSYTENWRAKDYQRTVDCLLDRNNLLLTSFYQIAELFKIIELNQYKLFLAQQQLEQKDFNLKKYRHDSVQRVNVKNELVLTYNTISNAVDIVEHNISKTSADNFLSDFTNHSFDYIDYNLAEYCKIEGVKNILTDDGDFSNYSVVDSDLAIYSANKKIISSI